MYLSDFLKSPSTVRVLAPDVWKVATGLQAVPGQKNTFRAENFDILYDSPFEASNFKTLVFNVKGVPHRIVIDGAGNYDPESMRRDVQKIVETEANLMGEIPYHDYTFILHLREEAGGGLEHLNSTALGFPRFGFGTGQGSRATSSGPNSVAEGITDYYAEVALRRSGLITEDDFLDAAARGFQGLQNTPGRLVQSAGEASFDAWIKYYRQDENSINSQVSYYDKGAILGLLLDLEIRKRSEGRKSLDDVMRYLYTEFYKKDRNYTPADFQKTVELMAGSSLEEFFARYVRGKDELDYSAALAAAGLALDRGVVMKDGKPVARATLGAELEQDQDRLMVRNVRAGTAAYDQGLNAGDQIVAMDNMRVTRDSLIARLAEKKPGDLVNLTIFRSDDLSTLLIKLGSRTGGAYKIVPLPNQTELQKQIYRAWLGVRA